MNEYGILGTRWLPLLKTSLFSCTAVSYGQRDQVYFSVARGKAADCELMS